MNLIQFPMLLLDVFLVLFDKWLFHEHARVGAAVFAAVVFDECGDITGICVMEEWSTPYIALSITVLRCVWKCTHLI